VLHSRPRRTLALAAGMLALAPAGAMAQEIEGQYIVVLKGQSSTAQKEATKSRVRRDGGRTPAGTRASNGAGSAASAAAPITATAARSTLSPVRPSSAARRSSSSVLDAAATAPPATTSAASSRSRAGESASASATTTAAAAAPPLLCDSRAREKAAVAAPRQSERSGHRTWACAAAHQGGSAAISMSAAIAFG